MHVEAKLHRTRHTQASDIVRSLLPWFIALLLGVLTAITGPVQLYSVACAGHVRHARLQRNLGHEVLPTPLMPQAGSRWKLLVGHETCQDAANMLKKLKLLLLLLLLCGRKCDCDFLRLPR